MKKLFSIALSLAFIFASLPVIAAADDAAPADSTLTDETVVNLGFIGWYNWKDAEGNIHTSQTSFYWQELKVGEFIDWDAVDDAYSDWVAKGGLEPDRGSGWKTSGYSPLHFADYANIGHSDFTIGQTESYYLSFYVNPGYKS